MPNFIDRRLNPKDKSLGNRRRFLKRAREELKRTIKEHVKTDRIADVDAGHKVPMPVGGSNEPTFRPARDSGDREYVLPGNREYTPGDRIEKQGGGGGGAGSGAGTGKDEDDFQFLLSREEVLDLFFEDLELPDMIKLSLKEAVAFKPRRAGFATSGSPTNINVGRTMRNSYGRRIALHRPGRKAVEALAEEIAQLEAEMSLDASKRQRLQALREELDVLERRRRRIPYVDPVDIRFNRFERQPLPNANAVMFCLMDVSSSMGEREKDLAKRFFVLLHLFLKRRYDRIDMVFIRHTDEAGEVDEDTFFYSTQSGGTVVSTALEEMLNIIRERYPAKEWNIYAAQASDGDNYASDSQTCRQLMDEEILPICQYFAYVEVYDPRQAEIFLSSLNVSDLWKDYQSVGEGHRNFAMKRVFSKADVFPVFRQLFDASRKAA
jgi:uncharacterized sporulation protein YeaH/YhbH (DUF444 family)